MRIALDKIHVMLDLDDGAHARGLRRRDQHLHDRMLVAGRNAAGRLIEQNDDRIERKSAGDIEQFLFALRQCGSDDVEPGAQAEHFRNALGIGLENVIAHSQPSYSRPPGSSLPAGVSFASDNSFSSGPSFFERLFGGPPTPPAPIGRRGQMQQRRMIR